MAGRKEPRIPDALLDQLLAGADPETTFDPNALLDDLKKALAERALDAEMDHHLATGEATKGRNGYGRQSVVTDTGKIDLEIPCDRQSTFDPQSIAEYQRCFPGFDGEIISNVGARQEHARDRRSLARTPRCRRLARSDRRGDRRRSRRGRRLAGPAARSDLPASPFSTQSE